MIRLATACDVASLHGLMLDLAVFEGYSDEFSVSADDLLRLGFRPDREPDFHCVVAEVNGALAGYALTYVIPFTYDLRPSVVLKELFVRPEFRSRGLGSRLFSTVVEQARVRNARLLRWQVLPSNHSARRFYLRHGGRPDRCWESWVRVLDKP